MATSPKWPFYLVGDPYINPLLNGHSLRSARWPLWRGSTVIIIIFNNNNNSDYNNNVLMMIIVIIIIIMMMMMM